MPLSAASASLGVALASAAGSVDAAGIAAWSSIGSCICSTLPGCVTSFDPTANDPMLVAAGVIVPDTGGFVTSSAQAALFGAALAVAAGSIDSTGIEKWLAIGNAIVDWMGTHGRYGGGMLAYAGPAPPTNGSVTGTGTVSFDDEAMGGALAEAADSTDDAGIEKWTAIGSAIIAAIKDNGAIAPGSMQNPAAGGAVAGSGTFS